MEMTSTHREGFRRMVIMFLAGVETLIGGFVAVKYYQHFKPIAFAAFVIGLAIVMASAIAFARNRSDEDVLPRLLMAAVIFTACIGWLVC